MSGVGRKLRLVAVASLIASGAGLSGPAVPAVAQVGRNPVITLVHFTLAPTAKVIEVHLGGHGFGGESEPPPWFGESNYFIFEDVTHDWSACNGAMTHFTGEYLPPTACEWVARTDTEVVVKVAALDQPWEPGDQVRIGVGNLQYGRMTADEYAGENTTKGESKGSAWWDGTLPTTVVYPKKPVIKRVDFMIDPAATAGPPHINVTVQGSGFGEDPAPLGGYDPHFILEDITNRWSGGNFPNPGIYGDYRSWADHEVDVNFIVSGLLFKPGDKMRIGLGNPHSSPSTVDSDAGESTTAGESPGSAWWNGTLSISAGGGEKPQIVGVTFDLVPDYNVIEVTVIGSGFGEFPDPLPYYSYDSRYFIFEDTTKGWHGASLLWNDYVKGDWLAWHDNRVVVYLNTFGRYDWKPGDRVKIGLGNPQYSGPTWDPYAGHPTMPDSTPAQAAKDRSAWWQGALRGPERTDLGNDIIYNGCFSDPWAGGLVATLGKEPSTSTEITGWKVDKGHVVAIPYGSVDRNAAPQCGWRLALELNGDHGKIFQELPHLVRGHKYRLQWAMAGDTGGWPHTKVMEVFWDGALERESLFDTLDVPAGTMGWVFEQLVVTAKGNDTVGFMDNSAGPNGAVLADVSLTALSQ
jgi:hypothetical protein